MVERKLRPHGKQAAYKTVDKAGVNRRISSEAARLDGRIDNRYTRAQVDSAIANAIARANAPRLQRVYPTLINGWTNDSSHRSLSYYCDSEGNVVFRGLIRPGNNAEGTTIFRLDSAVWPAFSVLFAVISSGSNNARVQIDSSGFALCYGEPNYMGFDGASFNLD